MYHLNISSSSFPALNQKLNLPENKKRNEINNNVSATLITMDEDAIEVLSLSLLPTNFIWALLRRYDFVVSNNVVTTRKKAHNPICGFVRPRMSIIKFIKPKSVREKRCRNVNKAERIQYDVKYFFKGEPILIDVQTYTKMPKIYYPQVWILFAFFWVTLQIRTYDTRWPSSKTIFFNWVLTPKPY